MAEKRPESERLRAPLMYAFRAAARAGDAKKKVDLREGGERVIAGRRAASARRRSLDDTALRNLLVQDVSNLLNTTNMESDSAELLDELDWVKKSILNFGLPDLATYTLDEMKVRGLRIKADLEAALVRYEPRLLARTIRVEPVLAENPNEPVIRFLIHSDMRADPMPTSVEFVTEIEKQSGEIKFKNA